ncbi:MAG: tRNA epoxyqueuosine(34) reductase QueG [Chloroflexi bacterium]|nr:tRNA epoxyqueuosine(34) reductase QueG [Chloroflexota bacterium]
MGYLARERSLERRGDPRRILPEAQSVLVAALPYPVPAGAQPEETSQTRGQVAAYAWGVDYHNIIPQRLQALAAFIEDRTGKLARQRHYTDTGPILERDLAQRAGLGWIGKNTCLIHPRYGSYFLLGEILLDIELEPDEPEVTDYCGSCRRCIDACPTQCILPDRTIDAGRCISYLTIEHKGSIPHELRPQMGNWVFGCDICQMVCPWNIRFASLPPDPALVPHPGIEHPDLIRELKLSPGEFNHKFRGSPIQRPHRRGYLRNVAIAMGNSRDPACLPALLEVLHHESEPLVRGHAAWAAGQIGGVKARRELEKALSGETDPSVISEIHSAIR